MYAVSFAELNFWVRRNDNFAFLVAIFLTFSLPTSDRHNETSMTSVYSYEEHDNRPLESAGLGKKKQTKRFLNTKQDSSSLSSFYCN